MKKNETAKTKTTLTSKSILSRILAGLVEECKGMSFKEIEDCIEGDVHVEEIYPFGDVLQAYLKLPNSSKLQLVKILISSKIQKTESPENDNPAQNLFECCRMVASQLDTESSAASEEVHSEAIKKLYSILITEATENSIERYGITKEMLCGDDPDQPGYDSVVAIIIRLNRNHGCDDTENELIRILRVLFDDDLSAD